MRAVRVSDGQVVVTDVAAPDGDGVDVRIRAAGICGSDLHMLGMGLTTTLGHEFAGELEDGTRVAVEPLTPCFDCPTCRSGRYHHCTDSSLKIMGVSIDGGMADLVRVPKSALVPLPAAVPTQDASLVEPLAISVHGIRRAGVTGTDRVAVVGGGTIGLTAVAAARSTGAPVDLLARHDHQKAAGERLGAGEVDTSSQYSVVIDCAGTTSSFEQSVSLTETCGRLLVLSTPWDGMTLPGMSLCLREIDLVPSAFYGRAGPSRDVDTAAALLGADPEIARSIITHRFPLDAAVEAFRVAADRKAGAIKVVLEP